jgi:hypothetical protein
VSDATPQIADEQFRSFEELDEHSEGTVLRLDTAQVLDAQIDEIARAVDGCGLGAPGPGHRRASRVAEIRRNVHVGSVEALDVRARQEV